VTVQPEEVLELIGSASQRYDTVRAALRYRGDGVTKREIRECILRTEAGRRAFRISPREAAEAIERPIDHPEPDGPFGWRSRAWHADDYHWRLEANRPDGGVNILASNGRTPSGAPPPGPQYMGRFWRHRVGRGSHEDEPRWFDLANDHYWTFYALCTDEISAGSPTSCAPWTSQLRVRCCGRDARRCAW
jgi:hypothetical protein